MELETVNILPEPEIPLGLRLHAAGITHLNPRYRMNRWRGAGYYILEYVISGRGVIESSGEPLHPQGGDAYLIAPGTPCEYYSDWRDPWEKIWFNVSGDLMELLARHYQMLAIQYFPACPLEQEFRAALEVVRSGKPESSRNLTVALHNILAKMYEHRARGNRRRAVSSDAQRLKDYLDARWHSKFSCAELCRLIHKSPAQMQRIFKKEWGVSPGRYVQQKRLDMAIQYLENTNFTIKRIAEHLGFGNEYYFANWFKAETGFAPKRHPLAAKRSGAPVPPKSQ